MDAYTKSTTSQVEKDEQETPDYVFNTIELVTRLHFVMDVAASAAYAKCPLYLTKEDDALGLNWLAHVPTPALHANPTGPMRAFWMNPPYSMLPEFTSKALAQATMGCIVVGLVPHMPSSTWFGAFVHNFATTVLMPNRRINFLLNGKVRSGNPLPSCVPIWTPWGGPTSYRYFDLPLEREWRQRGETRETHEV